MSSIDEAASVADDSMAPRSLEVVAVSLLVEVSVMTVSLPSVISELVAIVELAAGSGVTIPEGSGPVVAVFVLVPVVVVSVAVVVSPVMTEATSDRTSPIVEMRLPRPESALLEESVELPPVTCLLTTCGK